MPQMVGVSQEKHDMDTNGGSSQLVSVVSTAWKMAIKALKGNSKILVTVMILQVGMIGDHKWAKAGYSRIEPTSFVRIYIYIFFFWGGGRYRLVDLVMFVEFFHHGIHHCFFSKSHHFCVFLFWTNSLQKTTFSAHPRWAVKNNRQGGIAFSTIFKFQTTHHPTAPC